MSQNKKMTLEELLLSTVTSNASDLHIGADEIPALRVGGEIQRMSNVKLSAAEVKNLVDELMTDEQRSNLHRDLSVDFSFSLQDKARFRCNIYMQSKGLSMALRRIPARIFSLQELECPPVFEQIANLRRGLILVTGPTGSGKSTTLAAILHHINMNRAEHIITIEDPIEYIHQPQKCIINQREIGSHARSFASALRAALREDPDVILVGEMRDLETISLAITAAETGHLVLGTLHTNNCSESVDRIVDAYPSEEQKQIRIMLSNSLQAVISQTLCNKKNGKGRAALHEIMLVNPAIRNMIRESKSHQIYNVIDTSRAMGMQTMEVAIERAVQRSAISSLEADIVRSRVGLQKKQRAPAKYEKGERRY